MSEDALVVNRLEQCTEQDVAAASDELLLRVHNMITREYAARAETHVLAVVREMLPDHADLTVEFETQEYDNGWFWDPSQCYYWPPGGGARERIDLEDDERWERWQALDEALTELTEGDGVGRNSILRVDLAKGTLEY